MEVIITACLFLLIMAGTLSIYILGLKIYRSTTLKMQATQGASMGVARMTFGLGTNSGLREMAGFALLTDMNGVWTNKNYPPAANDSSHYITHAYIRPHPSWRLICTNYAGRVTWYDYNRAASNIVVWSVPNQPGNRELIANYVSAANITIDATNFGVNLNLCVTRGHGNHVESITNSTFIKARNWNH